ncbi:MAG TPA: hypothetical protein VNM90_19440 [Haliangium sp.]|nr:hypothetical protein [Haliangium sp.]
MTYRAPIAVLVLVSGARLAVAPSPAAAQETIVEGPGYEVGEGTVIHPSVGMTTGLLYNPFYENQSPESTPVLQLRGAVSIASQGSKPGNEIDLLKRDKDIDSARDAAPSLEFRAGGLLDLTLYTTTNETVARRLLSGSLTGHVLTAPRGPVSFYADEVFTRTSTPVNYESYGNDINRIINRLTGGVQFRPGDGAFRFALQYENTVDIFEPTQSDLPEESARPNRGHHIGRGRAEWQFLPITRFFLDTSWGYTGALSGASCGVIKRNARPLRIQLGAATALTELTSLRAHVGYGKGFYQSRGADCGEGGTPDFSNVLLGAELGYRYSPLGRLSVTYEYDFQDSVVANYYRDHALVGRLINQVDLVLLLASIDIRQRLYVGTPEAFMGINGETTHDHLIFRLSGKGYYLYRDWLAFTASLELVNDSTDFAYTDPDTAMSRQLGYTRTELQIGAVAAF